MLGQLATVILRLGIAYFELCRDDPFILPIDMIKPQALQIPRKVTFVFGSCQSLENDARFEEMHSCPLVYGFGGLGR